MSWNNGWGSTMVKKFEHIDLWFSYSSENAQVVNDITQQLDVWKDSPFDDVTLDSLKSAVLGQKLEGFIDGEKTSIKTDEVDDLISKTRVAPKTYSWEVKKGPDGNIEKVYQLLPNESIQSLVFEIARSLLRVVVISEDYFRSEVCMQELCMCLMSNQVKHNVFPMHLSLLKQPVDVFTSTKFEFSIPEKRERNGSLVLSDSFVIEQMTLPEALVLTHQYLLSKHGSEVYGFDTSEKSAEDFTILLTNLSELLFVPHKDAGSSCESIYRFMLSTVRKKEQNFWDSNISKLLNKLTLKPCTKQLMQYFPAFSDTGADLMDFFKGKPSLGTDLVPFINSIEQSLPALEFKANTYQSFFSDISQICTLAVLQCIRSVNANLLHHYQQAKALIPVTTFLDTDCTNQEGLLSGFAYSLAFKNIVDINIDGTTMEYEGLVTSRLKRNSPTESDSSSSYRLLRNIVDFYDRNLLDKIPKTMEEAKGNRGFSKQFHTAVSYAHQRNKVAILVIRYCSDRDEKGFYSMLTDVHQTLNATVKEEGKDFIWFPVIEVKPSRITNTKTSQDTWFSEDEFTFIRKSFHDLFTELSNLKPA